MILPEYQGDGAATAALDEIIKLAAGKKKRAVRLDAIGTNVPAQKLYEKYGFVNCGQHRSTMKVPEKQNSYFMNMHWRSSSYVSSAIQLPR